MSSIVEKVLEVIRIETLKNSDKPNFKEFQKLIAEMKRLGLYKKPEYNLPLRDTLGKVYLKLNKPRKAL